MGCRDYASPDAGREHMHICQQAEHSYRPWSTRRFEGPKRFDNPSSESNGTSHHHRRRHQPHLQVLEGLPNAPSRPRVVLADSRPSRVGPAGQTNNVANVTWCQIWSALQSSPKLHELSIRKMTIVDVPPPEADRSAYALSVFRKLRHLRLGYLTPDAHERVLQLVQAPNLGTLETSYASSSSDAVVNLARSSSASLTDLILFGPINILARIMQTAPPALRYLSIHGERGTSVPDGALDHINLCSRLTKFGLFRVVFSLVQFIKAVEKRLALKECSKLEIFYTDTWLTERSITELKALVSGIENGSLL